MEDEQAPDRKAGDADALMYEIYGHAFGSELEAIVVIAAYSALASIMGLMGLRLVKDEKRLRRRALH